MSSSRPANPNLGKSIRFIKDNRDDIQGCLSSLYDAIIETQNGEKVPFYQLFINYNAPEMLSSLLKKKDKTSGIAYFKCSVDKDIVNGALDYILTGKLNKESQDYRKVEEFLRDIGTTTTKWVKYTLGKMVMASDGLTDLKITSSSLTEAIPVHRIILACHSLWLRKKLQPTTTRTLDVLIKNLQSKKDNSFQQPMEINLDEFGIKNTKPQLIKALVKYLYLEDIDALLIGLSDSDLEVLFEIGNKLEIQSIMAVEARKLAKNLNMSNIGKIYTIAYQAEDTEIQEQVIHYIWANWSTIDKKQLEKQFEKSVFNKLMGIAEIYNFNRRPAVL
ncbi:hypothetical protein ABK040_010872 [Willaertia magna]